MKLKIYTDGSCKGNGSSNSRGGWAFVFIDEEEEIILKHSGREINTTNNRMELTAVIEAIQIAEVFAKSHRVIYCEIYTDSAYIHNCIKQKWYKNWESNGWITSKKTPVLNKDLWMQLVPYFEDARFDFFKVKGHTGKQDWNDMVDKLAQREAEKTIELEEKNG
jgi:ribonuclease HI